MFTTVLGFAQTAPTVENGFKSSGSYQSGDIDSVNLQTGNLAFHVPLLTYPQRGARLTSNLILTGNSKNWQVGEWTDKQHTIHQKWMLARPAGVAIADPSGFEVHRSRHLTTDTTGNQTYTMDDYAIGTGDGSWHWLNRFTPSNNMMTGDGSGIQLVLIPGTRADHSDDRATVIFRDGTRYAFSNISVPMPTQGQGNNIGGRFFPPELILDIWSTTQTAYDVALNINTVAVDGNGNVLAPNFDTLGRAPGTITQTSDYSHCAATSRSISGAEIWNYPGPDGRSFSLTVCYTTFTPSAAFSQPNVDPPSAAATVEQIDSFAHGIGSYISSILMPDGNRWSFDYDDYGNVTRIGLPTGGSIVYQWTEVPNNEVDGSATQVSRAVHTRTVNDNNGHSYPWTYTWGSLQTDGSITNYVLDPNGNETAHVFKSVLNNRTSFYETETRIYQGDHTHGTLLKTVDTTYQADMGVTNSMPWGFAGDVVPLAITTKLANGLVSQIVRQYDTGNTTMMTYGKVTNEKVYDYGNGAPGGLLRETVTTYMWQNNSAYLDAGLLDLPATVIVKDGAGCVLSETDYAYDEPAYLTSYTGTLPSGTHGNAPGGTIRGNPTTVTRWLAPASSCNPGGGTPVRTHTNWYDTGEAYQQIDALGNATTHSYDSFYAGAYSTKTCNVLNQCVSGTYDLNTGLLESFTDENAATPASGNTPGDAAHTSNFSYDTSWRLISAQGPPNPVNNQARPTTTFTPSAPNVFPLSVLRTHSVTTALTDQSTTYFDGLGRVYNMQHALPNGTANIDTQYDGLGQVTSVSNPYFSTSDATYGLVQTQYDALGRANQVTKQDGGLTKAQYNQTAAVTSGDCTISTDEAGHVRKTCADALGRLMEVDEPNQAAPAVPAQGALTITGSLQSHTTSGSPGVQAAATLDIWSGDGSGLDMHFDDPSEPCPPFPQTCPQIYDTGWVRVTVNGIAAQVSYGRIDSWSTVAANLVSAINASGANAYVTASVPQSGTHITLQAKTAGAAGNAITLSTASASNDPGDFGSGSFGASPSGSTLSGGADAINPVTIYDQGIVTLTAGSFTASAPYGQNSNSTAAQVAQALVSPSNPNNLNRAGSPVNASATGATLAITYNTGGSVGNGFAITGSGQSTQSQWTFSPPSMCPPPGCNATLGNGIDPGDINNHPLVTLYSYSGLDNLITVTQKGDPAVSTQSQWRVRNFSYNSLSQLLTATNPESGTISYSYDANGNLLQKTSPAPNQTGAATQTISYCYDALNRVTGKAYSSQTCSGGLLPAGTAAVSYFYDQTSYQGLTITNGKGRLTGLSDQAGTGAYSFDALGRIANENRTIAGIQKGLAYTYNLDSSVATLSYPSGAVVTYTPDSAGRMLSAVDTGNNINYVTGAGYDATSALTGFVSGPSSNFAGITNSFSYNKRLQPLTISAASPSATVFSIGYDFHFGNGDNGNVFGITNNRDGSRSQTFTYDALNRLASAQNTGTDCTKKTVNNLTEYWGNNYGYDAWGNLLQKTITKCGAENLSVAALANNQLAGYAYDAAGNMTHDATTGSNYSYDQENRITGAAGYTYTYDADGNRVEKSNGTTGTIYWYMSPGIVAESDLTGALKSEYVFFDGRRTARKDFPGGAVSYYFSDHLKTAHVITDSAGTIKEDEDFYPWGEELPFVNNDSNKYKFSDKERDAETGLDYFGARFYGNALSRFTSPDPKMISKKRMADPQQWNMYAYVRNNPLIYVDPDGKELNLWLVVKDQSNRDRVIAAAPKIANDFHRWGVKQVNVHITSNNCKFVINGKTDSVVVRYENDPSMTKSSTFGEHYLGGAITVNTGLTNFESSIRNVTDHEVTHEAQPFWKSNGISSLFNLDHSSDSNDIMYAQYNPLQSADPQMSQDEQQMVQNNFNKPNDQNQVTVVDEDKKPDQKQDHPQLEQKKDHQQ